jgi:teichuronic acid exporter
MAFKKHASKGIFWAFTEQLGVKGLGLVVQILIARLLVPDDFGLIAMIAVFIGVGDLLVDSGLGQSLIRTREPQQADFSTVFYLNITSAFVIYLMFYVTAPHLADFYNRTELINILRVFSFAIIFGSFSVVQKAILTINMNFRKQMLIQIPSLLISSLIGLALAYKGQGVWAIVFMKVLYPFFASILYWVYSDWRPILIFDVDKLKYHYLFGYKLMITYMLNAFFNDIYSVLIGKYYSANILGFYDTLLVAHLADATICAVRANHTDKKLIPFSLDLSKTKRLVNMSYVINGVKENRSYGYNYNYGYNYGYGDIES